MSARAGWSKLPGSAGIADKSDAKNGDHNNADKSDDGNDLNKRPKA